MKLFFTKILLILTLVCFVGEQVNHLFWSGCEEVEIIEKEAKNETKTNEKEENNPKTIHIQSVFQILTTYFFEKKSSKYAYFLDVILYSTMHFDVIVPPPDCF